MVVAALNWAMDEDDAKSAKLAWSAVLGSSQGLKVAASWLFRKQQQQQKEDGKGLLGQMAHPQRAEFCLGIDGRSVPFGGVGREAEGRW